MANDSGASSKASTSNGNGEDGVFKTPAVPEKASRRGRGGGRGSRGGRGGGRGRGRAVYVPPKPEPPKPKFDLHNMLCPHTNNLMSDLRLPKFASVQTGWIKREVVWTKKLKRQLKKCEDAAIVVKKELEIKKEVDAKKMMNNQKKMIKKTKSNGKRKVVGKATTKGKSGKKLKKGVKDVKMEVDEVKKEVGEVKKEVVEVKQEMEEHEDVVETEKTNGIPNGWTDDLKKNEDQNEKATVKVSKKGGKKKKKRRSCSKIATKKHGNRRESKKKRPLRKRNIYIRAPPDLLTDICKGNVDRKKHGLKPDDVLPDARIIPIALPKEEEPVYPRLTYADEDKLNGVAPSTSRANGEKKSEASKAWMGIDDGVCGADVREQPVPFVEELVIDDFALLVFSCIEDEQKYEQSLEDQKERFVDSIRKKRRTRLMNAVRKRRRIRFRQSIPAKLIRLRRKHIRHLRRERALRDEKFRRKMLKNAMREAISRGKIDDALMRQWLAVEEREKRRKEEKKKLHREHLVRSKARKKILRRKKNLLRRWPLRRIALAKATSLDIETLRGRKSKRKVKILLKKGLGKTAHKMETLRRVVRSRRRCLRLRLARRLTQGVKLGKALDKIHRVLASRNLLKKRALDKLKSQQLVTSFDAKASTSKSVSNKSSGLHWETNKKRKTNEDDRKVKKISEKKINKKDRNGRKKAAVNGVDNKKKKTSEKSKRKAEKAKRKEEKKRQKELRRTLLLSQTSSSKVKEEVDRKNIIMKSPAIPVEVADSLKRGASDTADVVPMKTPKIDVDIYRNGIIGIAKPDAKMGLVLPTSVIEGHPSDPGQTTASATSTSTLYINTSSTTTQAPVQNQLLAAAAAASTAEQQQRLLANPLIAGLANGNLTAPYLGPAGTTIPFFNVLQQQQQQLQAQSAAGNALHPAITAAAAAQHTIPGMAGLQFPANAALGSQLAGAALLAQVPTAPRKPGRWCGMHVRIAVDISNIMQKEKKDIPPTTVAAPMPSVAKAAVPVPTSATSVVAPPPATTTPSAVIRPTSVEAVKPPTQTTPQPVVSRPPQAVFQPCVPSTSTVTSSSHFGSTFPPPALSGGPSNYAGNAQLMSATIQEAARRVAATPKPAGTRPPSVVSQRPPTGLSVPSSTPAPGPASTPLTIGGLQLGPNGISLAPPSSASGSLTNGVSETAAQQQQAMLQALLLQHQQHQQREQQLQQQQQQQQHAASINALIAAAQQQQQQQLANNPMALIQQLNILSQLQSVQTSQAAQQAQQQSAAQSQMPQVSAAHQLSQLDLIRVAHIEQQQQQAQQAQQHAAQQQQQQAQQLILAAQGGEREALLRLFAQAAQHQQQQQQQQAQQQQQQQPAAAAAVRANAANLEALIALQQQQQQQQQQRMQMSANLLPQALQAAVSAAPQVPSQLAQVAVSQAQAAALFNPALLGLQPQLLAGQKLAFPAASVAQLKRDDLVPNGR